MTLRFKFSTLFIVIFLLFSSAPLTGTQASNLLDGLAFTGKNGEKGKALDPDEDEEIVFANGVSLPPPASHITSAAVITMPKRSEMPFTFQP